MTDRSGRRLSLSRRRSKKRSITLTAAERYSPSPASLSDNSRITFSRRSRVVSLIEDQYRCARMRAVHVPCFTNQLPAHHFFQGSSIDHQKSKENSRPRPTVNREIVEWPYTAISAEQKSMSTKTTHTVYRLELTLWTYTGQQGNPPAQLAYRAVDVGGFRCFVKEKPDKVQNELRRMPRQI
jgi:hypothetical protein